MNRQLITLSEEKLQDIYIDDDFLTAVAYAHGCLDRYHKHLHYKALSYPIEYIVTEKQIAQAKAQLARRKDEVYTAHGNDLLFVGMGAEYKPRYEDDVCNYRIRTEFLNKHGKRYFIEFTSHAKGFGFSIDHAIDRDKEIELNRDFNRQGEYYNYKRLETKRLGHRLVFIKSNILKIVNKYFDCCFQNVIVDQHIIHTTDREIICESPKK